MVRQGKRITTQAPRFRDPKTGVWLPAVILPDELGSASAQELTRMLLREPSRVRSNISAAEILGTPLAPLIQGALGDK